MLALGCGGAKNADAGGSPSATATRGAGGASVATGGAHAPNAAASAATGAGGGGAGAAAGNQAPPAANGNLQTTLTPPDPKIMFDWAETQPGKGNCQPGTYSGTFSCDYTGPGIDSSAPFQASGPVVFTLKPSANGEFLEIVDGHIDGNADVIFSFTAKLMGKLDCTTNSLAGMATDGAYGFGDATAGQVGAFQGDLSGNLDRNSVTLSGNWNMMITDGLGAGGACVGPWMATWMP